MKNIIFNNKNSMPVLGFGTYKLTDNAAECVLNALEVGYRRIDTASFYHNDAQIGTALAQCGIPREQIFVTEKLWTSVQTAADVNRAVEEMLANLRTNFIDLLLIHWPTQQNLVVWKQMENLCGQGVVKNIGVSNFLPHHLDEILANATILPVLNQVELHPYFQQKDLRAYCDAHKIAVEAWSPLLRGNALEDPILQIFATRHGKSVAQIILRYDIQLGIAVSAKSSDPSRMRQNFDIFDFELTQEEMRAISKLDQNLRRYRDPDNHGY